jgi:hypothetical protein
MNSISKKATSWRYWRTWKTAGQRARSPTPARSASSPPTSCHSPPRCLLHKATP